MRVRLPIGRSLFFAGAVLLGLVALLPMRLVAGWLDPARLGFSAREVRGSIWSGGISEVRIGGAPLGDLTARLRPLPLLLGRVRIDLAGAGLAPMQASVTIARHRLRLDGVTGRVPLDGRAMPLPITAIDLADASLRLRDGFCEQAGGMVRVTIAGAPGGVPLPVGMSGALRCDGGAVLLPLIGQSGMERLTLRLAGDGSWRADLHIRPTMPAARDALVRAGFTPSAEGYALGVAGRL